MFLNYMRTAWRMLLHHKVYSIINITGLGTSMAVCLLIGLFVENELSFDKQVPARENVFG